MRGQNESDWLIVMSKTKTMDASVPFQISILKIIIFCKIKNIRFQRYKSLGTLENKNDLSALRK